MLSLLGGCSDGAATSQRESKESELALLESALEAPILSCQQERLTCRRAADARDQREQCDSSLADCLRTAAERAEAAGEALVAVATPRASACAASTSARAAAPSSSAPRRPSRMSSRAMQAATRATRRRGRLRCGRRRRGEGRCGAPSSDAARRRLASLARRGRLARSAPEATPVLGQAALVRRARSARRPGLRRRGALLPDRTLSASRPCVSAGVACPCGALTWPAEERT